jgi:uncharacterized protein
MADEEKSQEEVDAMFDDPPAAADEAPDDASDNELEESAEDEPADSGDESADGDGKDYEDLDLEDIDFPDDDFDEDYDDEDDDGEGIDKQKWIIIGAAVFVVVAVISGGAMFFLGGGDDEAEETADNNLPAAALSLKIPPKNKARAGGKMKMGRSTADQKDASQPAQSSSQVPASGQSTSAPANTTPAIASRPRTEAGVGVIIKSVTAIAYQGIPMMQNPKPLPGPDKQLGESVGGSVIPKISADGRQPWQVYAKPFTGATNLARIGIIIEGLGFSRAATIAAVNHTPAEVTLAFNPYAKNVGDWVGLARTAGHETLMMLPMETADFPTSDPGPFALQTDLKQNDNIERLQYIMSLSIGNVGFLQSMGSRFTTSQDALTPVLNEIRIRGLLMIDNGLVAQSQIVKIASTIALPRARSDVYIDQDPSRLGIMRGLSKLVELAEKNASAIGIARALPSTLTNIMAWTKTLPGKKLILAPISAIVKISGSGGGGENQAQVAPATPAAPAGQPPAPAQK